jgi:hypothetical protein
MSAILNGTSAYLVTANALIGSTPNYPFLTWAWVKLANVTAAHSCLWLSDNAALASIDFLDCSVRGDVANDPVRISSAAAGSGNVSVADVNGVTAGTWHLVGAYYAANNSRQAILDSTLGVAQTTARAVSGLTHAAIGTQYFQSTPNTFLSGRVAEFGFASGFTAGNITAILTQLAAGVRPTSIAELVSSINACQPCRSGLANSGAIGPAWTNNNVTFDANDHPIRYGSSSPPRMAMCGGIFLKGI